MQTKIPLAITAAALGAIMACPARAHVIAGVRVFPVTLTLDDPGVSDEASLPAFSFQRIGVSNGGAPSNQYDFGFEYDKTITSNTALIANYGYEFITNAGAKNQSGFSGLTVTGKWQAYTNAEHEFVTSLGVSQGIGGTGSEQVGADQTGTTGLNGYFGKGLGDLPIGMLRPLAVTGELTYSIANKSLKQTQVTDPDTGLISTQFNNGTNNSWFGGISIQYSIPYLQSQVKNVGLNEFFGNLIPLVEFTWESAASSPNQQSTTWTAAPGVIYLAQWGEIGLEALVPLNKAAGKNIGAVALVHFFFDDLFPNSIGKPIFQ
jgi:hypothetical protein